LALRLAIERCQVHTPERRAAPLDALLLVRDLALEREDAGERREQAIVEAELDHLAAVLVRVCRLAEEPPDLLRRPEPRDERGADPGGHLDPVVAREILAAEATADGRGGGQGVVRAGEEDQLFAARDLA